MVGKVKLFFQQKAFFVFVLGKKAVHLCNAIRRDANRKENNKGISAQFPKKDWETD
jgi:hypothetical protein